MHTATLTFANAPVDFTRKHLEIKSGINHIEFSPDGRMVASSDVYMHVKVSTHEGLVLDRDFSVANEKIRPTQRIRGLKFSDDGRVLFVAAADTLLAVEIASGAELWTYTPPRAWGFLIVSPAALTTRRGLVASAFDNGSIGVWSEDGGPQVLWNSNDGPRMLSFLNDGTLLGCDSFSLNIWDWQERRSLRKVRLSERVYGMTKSSAAPVAATRGLHGVQLWDTDSLTPIAALPVRIGLPIMAFHPSLQQIAIAEKHGIRVFDFGGAELAYQPIDAATVLSASFNHDGTEIAIGCSDSEIRHWTL